MPCEPIIHERAIVRLVRDGDALVGATATDMDFIRRYPAGRFIDATLWSTPSGEKARLYRMLCAGAARATGAEPDAVDFRCRMAAGFFSHIERVGDVDMLMPRPVASLDDGELMVLLNRTEEHLTTIVCPGATREGLIAAAKSRK